jgi:hypothetical protein
MDRIVDPDSGRMKIQLVTGTYVQAGGIRSQEARMAPHKENKMKQCHVSKKVKKQSTFSWIWEVIVV